MTRKQALVWWSRENKVGIENITSVPSNARFDGAVTPVMFGGDKKHYPAKIIMISDDSRTLEKKLAEVEAEIEKQKQAAVSEPVKKSDLRSKRKSKPVSKGGVANEREIAAAVGVKQPVPKNLVPAHQAAQQDRKAAEESLKVSTAQNDSNVLSIVKKQLFAAGNDTMNDSDCDLADSDEADELPDDAVNAVDEVKENQDSKWCSCNPCNVLQKYDKPMFHCFLKELCGLLDVSKTSDGKKQLRFLELLPIPEEQRKVELAIGTGVYIGATSKDELKVDFRNRPGTLARETLFVLYGKEAFQTVLVTGRGNKDGTYTIPDDVKKAITSFVNKHSAKDKSFTTKHLVTLINKRAPEWRKSQSPKNAKRKKPAKKMSDVRSPKTPKTRSPLKTPSKIVTSPFKVTPTKSPRQSKNGTPKRQRNSEPPSFDSVLAALNAANSSSSRQPRGLEQSAVVPSASTPRHGQWGGQFEFQSRQDLVASEFSSGWNTGPNSSGFSQNFELPSGGNFNAQSEQQTALSWNASHHGSQSGSPAATCGSAGPGQGHWRPFYQTL